MKKYISLVLILMAFTLLITSCSKNNAAKPDNGGITGKSSYKITYKVFLPTKFTGQASFTAADGTAASVDNITGNWTSQEYTFKKETAAAITASASSSDNTSGEMVLQILESGKVVKEVKSTGAILSGTADVALN